LALSLCGNALHVVSITKLGWMAPWHVNHVCIPIATHNQLSLVIPPLVGAVSSNLPASCFL